MVFDAHDKHLDEPVIRLKASISDIAKLAGVGTATVDRVLNERDNVRESTRQRVLQAKAAIETGRPVSEQKRPWRLKVLLPGDAGATTYNLASCLQELGNLGNATIECVFVKKMDPVLLARKLSACSGQGIDAVAFQALDHPSVQNAVEDLAALNIPSLPIMSNVHSNATIGFVGLDNRAAGRTAGHLMGRLTKQAGSVAIVVGSHLYQVHEDREIGFRAAIRHGFPHISDIIPLVGHDNRSDNYMIVKEALEKHSNLIGIYNVGGANPGIADALQEADVANELVFIGHHLTRNTQNYLLDGTMDMVLHLNLRAVAQQTVNTLIAHLENRKYTAEPLKIEVVTRENTVGVQANV